MGHSRWNAPKAHGEHTGYGKTSRREIPNLLRDCKPFDGFSMRARWVPATSLPELAEFSLESTDGALYVIYSYDQAIGAYDPSDGTLHESHYFYSGKTSEHQTNARAWTGKDFRNRNETWGVQYRVEWNQLPQGSGYIGELI